METVSITEAKNRLSALIDRVRSGRSILILDRGTPVARLEPVAEDSRTADATVLDRLERAGLLRRGKGPPPLHLIASPGPRPRDGASAVAALLAERRSGR